MLAYVFWHWAAPAVGREAYEAALGRFHRALLAARIRGFRGSVACRVQGAPWLPGTLACYEDWYLLDGLGDLEALRAGAISGACGAPHDEVARHALGSTAGLYHLVSGELVLPTAPTATWASKPERTSYGDFSASLAPWTVRPAVSVWQRQLALGPTPEFCILSPGVLPPDLPLGSPPITVQRDVVVGPPPAP